MTAEQFRVKNSNTNMHLFHCKKSCISFLSDYHCGGYDGWSSLYFFKALKSGVDWSPRMAVFGDLGRDNAKSLSYLQEETQQGKYDVFLHVGKLYNCILIANAFFFYHQWLIKLGEDNLFIVIRYSTSA